ncbi:Oidioi.mRNA.OKI2018_I69.PAR.g9045.t1.cds [Oikopleura dioica]|uniref:Oidioi.mRNA.OKI2018_I69.PAR.g9045.t1.cds n=1 Tax=Oikopleura dioica TaxID=34765 RepID=A0ABN7RPR1_OIKDI|nr:Oidioi.mRNA.OKI2018_I69.PAR.g9045.t1.cds [Oikopleura dioica]
MNRSQLRDALAINDLKRNIFDVEGVIQKLPNSYPGPSWKFPQRQAKDIDVEEQSARFSAGEDVMNNFHAQLSLLELLVDRIHFLILSCADVQSVSFTSIGGAGESLLNSIVKLRQGDLSGFTGGHTPCGSSKVYSPNYEEDVRREMFPLIQSLVVSVNTLCNNYVLPCESNKIWQRENRKLDKCTFVRVTTALRNDMEKITKLFSSFDKKVVRLKSQIDEKQNESNKFKSLWEASKESLKKQKDASENEIKSLQRDIQLFREEKDVLSREHSLHLSSANKNLSKTKEKLEKLAREKEELSRSKSLEETTRKNLEKEHETLKRANSDLASQVKLFKTESVKMKRKMVELVEAEHKSQKSEAENDELRRNLVQKDDAISVLSKEVERAKQVEKKQLSMIEMFKEQVKNATSCGRCCEHEVQLENLQTKLENLTEKLSLREEKLANTEHELHKVNQENKSFQEKCKLLVTYPDLVKDQIPVPDENLSINQQLLYQIEANQIRMELLEEENTKLRAALGKLSPQASRPSSGTLSAWGDAPIPVPSHGWSWRDQFQDLENNDDNDDDLLDSPLPSDLRSMSQMSLASRQNWLPNRPNSVRSNVSSVRKPLNKRVASPMYHSTSHAPNNSVQCVQWNAGRRKNYGHPS